MRSTPTNLTPPKVGKPLKRSWVESVTGNMNREQIQPGSWTEGPVNFASAPSPYINPVMLRVKNMTGLSLPMFSVLRITSPEITDKASFPHTLRGQQNEFLGYIPMDSCDERIVITSYYADPETVLPCMISGPTPVKILFPDSESLDYPYAVPINGDYTRLLASPFGKIQILWHSDPEVPQEGCDARTLWAWVCMGENGEWCWYKLQEDLAPCGKAMALLTDECGNQVGECPIYRDVYGPKGYDVCGCSNAQTGWKAGDVVPALWYEYLCRWVTIPNFNANFIDSELEVVTDLNIEDIKWEPTGTCRDVLVDVQLDTSKISFTTESVPVEVTGSGTLDTAEVVVSGPVQVNGSVGVSGEIEFNIDAIADVGGTCTITGTAPVEISGELNVEFTDGDEVEVLDDVSVELPDLATVNETVFLADSASFSGELDLTGPTTDFPVSIEAEIAEDAVLTEECTISYVTPSEQEFVTGVTLSGMTYEKATGVSASGMSGTLDLSQMVEEKTVVTGISLSEDGCTITWTTETVRVFKDSVDVSAIPVSVSGNVTLQTTTQNISGNLSVQKQTLPAGATTIQEFSRDKFVDSFQIEGTAKLPYMVNGNVTLNKVGKNFLSNVYFQGEPETTKTTKKITLPKAGSSTQEVVLTGEADLGKAPSTFSISGLTAPIQTTVKQEVALWGDVSLSNSEVVMRGTVGANVTISTGNLDLPTGIEVTDGGVLRSFECIPIYELEGGGVTNLEKAKVRILTCGECEE